MLLVGAGLVARSLFQLMSVDLGFSTEQVHTVGVRIPATAFGQPGDEGSAGLFILVRAGEKVSYGWLELPQVHEAVWETEGSGSAVEIALDLTQWDGGVRIPLTTLLPGIILAM